MHAKTREGEMFREVAEQGHYAGRTEPTATRQGIYAMAPGGAFLASINTRSPRPMAGMLERALAAWEELPDDRRYLSPGALAEGGGWRWRDAYPEDGLVLVVHSRDLPREDPPDDWRAFARNRDYAWFRAGEAARWLPEELAPGKRRSVPRDLALRLARLHLIDNVRGQVPAFEPGDVERAELTSRVTAVEEGRVELALSGSVRTARHGRWAVDGFQDMHRPSAQERGLELELLGRATWDPSARRFVAFELVALGTRWGATQYNGRTDDPGPAGIAFALVLAAPDQRVEPAAIWAYGWK